jgi:hypothetical protein
MKLKLINDGIYKRGGGYVFDFNNDSVNDVVFFYGENYGIKKIKTDNLIIYYGFENRKGFLKDGVQIAKFMKSNPNNPNVDGFMNMAVSEFKGFISKNGFKPSLVTYPESSSGFNAVFANKLNINPVVHNGFEKLFASNVSVDFHIMKHYKLGRIPDIDNIIKCCTKWLGMIDPKSEERFFSKDDRTDTEYIKYVMELCESYKKAYKDRVKQQQILDKIIDEFANAWTINEFRKLINLVEIQSKEDLNSVSGVKFKIKDIEYKDKRQFIDFLTYNINLSQSLGSMSNVKSKEICVLVIDDNVDSGGTFETIHRLNRTDIKYLFYSPFRIV